MKRYYKQDDLIQMSNGEYSDYCVGPIYRVTENFDLESVVASVEKTEQFDGSIEASVAAVEEAIINAGKLEEVETTKLWVGAYGRHYEWQFDE
jgi:hypothetical protein